MRHILTLLGLIFCSYCWTQTNSVGTKLEKLSKEFTSTEKSKDGNTMQSVFMTFKNDTLFIFDSKKLDNEQYFTNSIYLIPVKEVEGFKYTEQAGESKRYCDLEIRTIDNMPSILQMTEISESPLKKLTIDEEAPMFYDANFKIKIALPVINKTSLYTELEIILMTLLK